MALVDSGSESLLFALVRRRSSRKLKKSQIFPSQPPVLPPLSFIPDDPAFLSSPTSDDSASPLLRRPSVLKKSTPPPSAEQPTSPKKLVKKRPSQQALRSRYAPLDLTSSLPPSYTPVAPLPNPILASPDAVPPQRSKSLMILPRFGLGGRRSRPHAQSVGKEHDHPPPSSWRRYTASESGHEPYSRAGSQSFDERPLHGLVESPQPIEPISRSSRSSHSHYFCLSDSAAQNSSLAHSSDLTDRLSPPIPIKRAKFTLEPDQSSTISHHAGSISSPSPTSSKPTRPPLIRRDANFSRQRRWTLAMAMTDEGITDEVLVEELERICMIRRLSAGDDQGELSIDDVGWDIWDAGYSRNLEASDGSSQTSGPAKAYHVSEDNNVKIPYTPSLPSFPTVQFPHRAPNLRSTTTPVTSWRIAQRALLTCRELVRTERHYLASLQLLLASDTSMPPPLGMLRLAEGVAHVSHSLLTRMEEDPSAWGVAAAFVAWEDSIESAYTSWCAAVGEWFVNKQNDSAEDRQGKEAKEGGALDGNLSPVKRTMSTLRKSMPSIAGLGVTVSIVSPTSFQTPSTGLSLNRRREKEKELTDRRSLTAPSTATGAKKPFVRDLAILPTQRITRYVLLYRDLLAHTPSTSPSRALVERAVEAARRIAQKCDSVQGNIAFSRGLS